MDGRGHVPRRAWAGLSIFSMLVVLAAGGADTASATRLCPTLSCEPVSVYYPANTPFTASLKKGTELKLLSSLGNVACKTSTLAGETTAEAGEPLPLEVTEFKFAGNCHLGESECTVGTFLPASQSLEASGEGNGVLSLEGGEVSFKCGIINCTYTEIPALSFGGGRPARLDAKELELTEGSGTCPENAALDATYTLTKPIWAAYAVEIKGQTFLCSSPSCEPTGVYPENTSLAATLEEGTSFRILSSIGTLECESSSIAGETNNEFGKPLKLKITELSFTGNCHLGALSPCTSTIISLPTTPWLEATGEGSGLLSIGGAENIEGNVRFKCGSFLLCFFTIPAGEVQFKGGNPASIVATKVALKGLGFCPETSEIDATYTLTEPAPAYAEQSEGQTLLCEATSCEPTGSYPIHTSLAASLKGGTSFEVLTNLGTIHCESSTIVGKTTAEEAKALPVGVSKLSVGECNVAGTGCTATTVALPSSSALEATEEGNGTLSLKGGEVQFKCSGVIDCTFVMPALQFEGGNPATLSAKEAVPKSVKGSLCPGASAFDVTYALAEPAPAYLGM